MELAFDVSNLEAVVGDIKEKGVEVCLPPIDINMGSGSKGMIAYIRDPDGTIIELVEVKTVADEKKIDWRTASFVVALGRIFEAIKLKGY